MCSRMPRQRASAQGPDSSALNVSPEVTALKQPVPSAMSRAIGCSGGANKQLCSWRTDCERLSAAGMVAECKDHRVAAGLRTFIFLILRIHFRALRLTPRRYLIALWWRILGKRVRARSQLAPLLAMSPLAYQLWLRGEARTVPNVAPTHAPPILTLVYGSEKVGTCELERTLRSIEQEGFKANIAKDITSQAIDPNKPVWVMPLAAGDVLAAGAGDAYRNAAFGRTQIVYADDDVLDASGRRRAPHFKPTWNSELFRYHDFLTGACMVHISPQDLTAHSGPDWAERLIANIVHTNVGVPARIPRVLHHRLARPAPIPLPIETDNRYLPRVSVIVPTRNGLTLLRTCIEGLRRTDYPDMEVIIVDNGSDDLETLAYLQLLECGSIKVLRQPGPFNFSSLNNQAAKHATGEVLCLLNNDIEVLQPDWLRTMVAQALRSDVGAVGAQLLYPDGRIQHAGVVLGICGGAAHAHRLLRPSEEGYHRRHALPQFVSAVTAACLVLRRERFEAVGGLDETNFAVAFNDVDLCKRLNEKGWQSLYEPRAVLVHHESVSRGFDRDAAGAARLAKELAALKSAWLTDTIVDPYHHPQLNQFSEQFVVRL